LLANKGGPDERLVTEDEIATFQVPLVILGDPGLGKTKLTEALENALAAVRVTGGTFYRNEDPTRFAVAHGRPLIIDGLDEITSSSGSSAVDEVLKKLSRIGMPRFILSCRAADWQGSTDRYKIATDYGVEPTTLLLQQFSREDAITFLSAFDESIEAEDILDELTARDLGELYGNPLTLTLLAELSKDGQGLPESRADLFNRACELLVREENRAHHNSQAAQSSLDNLLDSAGAIFSHLLLSGSLGVAERHRGGVPNGYVSKGDLENISSAPLVSASLKTRLFQSAGENLFIPFHRVIAEFLGARWLSIRLSNGLSQRRVLQSLTFADGVPTALRGIHAWLAHSNPSVADRCILADPYGVLRYGEPSQLPASRARLLLSSLASLANEDPYFRSEDWGRRAVAGLARSELKDQIVDLIRRPDRHFHLSTLILEALPGSSLTDEIVPELMTLIQDANAAYAERRNAVEALVKSDTKTDWVSTVRTLTSKSGSDNRRLALEIIADVRGVGFTGDQIADELLNYMKVFPTTSAAGHSDDEGDDDDDRYVAGYDTALANELSPAQCADVLDGIATRVAAKSMPRHWRAGSTLSSTVQRLFVKAIEDIVLLNATRIWSWLKFLEGTRSSYFADDGERIYDFFRTNPALRREVQKVAIGDDQIDGTPWIAIVHVLPTVSAALAVTDEDTIGILTEIALKDTLSNFDIELWASLVRSRHLSDGFADEIREATKFGTQRHAELQRQFEDITTPPKRDWRKEQEERQAREQKKRLRRFGKHRANFLSVREGIESGSHFNALNSMANAYLNRYHDLDHDAAPLERLRQWLGDELTEAALSGFVAFLSRNDLPTAKQIADLHSEGKSYNAEPIMTCGILEIARTHRPLNRIPRSVIEAVLASWWEFSDFNSIRYGDEAKKQLEGIIFSSDEAIERFLTSVMESRIRAKQSHVPGLYQLPRDERFRRVAGRLALRWLRAYPDALSSTQWELLETAIQHARSDDVIALIRERVPDLAKVEIEFRRMWMSAAFLLSATKIATIYGLCEK